jgi:outer membrane protein assembly factor BamA
VRARLAALLCAAAISSGCGGTPAKVTEPVSSTPKKPVVTEVSFARIFRWKGRPYDGLRLRFEGNAHATARELSEDLAIPHGLVDDETLERDMLVVQAWYYDHGYVDIHVEPPKIHPSEGGHELVVVVVLDEGAQYTISSLEVYEELGGKRVPPIAWSSSQKAGAIFSRRELASSKMAMETVYRDLGYAFVDAMPETKIDKGKHQIGVAVSVRRGLLAHFGKIRFSGNTTTSEAAMKNEVFVTEGSLYTETGLSKSKARLLDTGWFVRVDVSTKQGAKPDLVDVSFEVDERPSHVPPLSASR